MPPITKTIILFPDCLNFGVEAFADCGGDPLLEVSHYLSHILAESTRALLITDLNCECVAHKNQAFKMAKHPACTSESPTNMIALFDRPSPRCLQMQSIQSYGTVAYVSLVSSLSSKAICISIRSASHLLSSPMFDAPLCAPYPPS